ncbi:MAG: DUF3857 domain-containing protein [Candidatus Aminicenantes bacterium]|nr:DUF3857 domain-containing protein [Candidatus Aminicenantes bacterium]
MLRVFAIGVIALILCQSLVAAEPAGPPDWVRLIREAGNADQYPGASVLVVLDQTRVEVMDTGLSHVRQKTLFKILQPEGAAEMKALTFGYDPQSAYVEIRSARIVRKDGKVEELDLSRVTDYPAPARAIYWGAREKMLPVGRLEVGDGLAVQFYRKGYTYALLQQDATADDSRYIPPMKGHFYDIVPFYSHRPVKVKRYEVTIPREKELQYEFYNGAARHFARIENDRIHYLWEKTDIAAFKPEPNQVSPSDVAPKLLLSTSPDWQAKSLWFHRVNEDFGSFEFNDEIKAKVDEIVAGTSDPWEKISRLTHWVAEEIRYSGISMGEGEGFTLHPGSMTFRDRCGVCKDKAGMLVTMLRAAGFVSYPAMTMAGSRIDRIPADQFNHSVTVVKVDNEYHLLDPTWVPGVRELWSSAEQQQEYLMGIPEGADLMSTPTSPAENHYLYYTIDTRVEADGGLTADVRIEAEGQSDSGLRRFLGFGPLHRRADMQRAALCNGIPGADVSRLVMHDPEDLSKPMFVSFRIHVPGALRPAKAISLLKPLSFQLPLDNLLTFSRVRTEMKTRKYAFRTRCSQLVRVKETIRLPHSMSLANAPEWRSVTSSGADFQGKITQKGNQISLFREIKLKKRIYEADEWPGFRDSVRRFSDPEHGLLVFRHGGKQ